MRWVDRTMVVQVRGFTVGVIVLLLVLSLTPDDPLFLPSEEEDDGVVDEDECELFFANN